MAKFGILAVMLLLIFIGCNINSTEPPPNENGPISLQDSLYLFVKSLHNSTSGLISSREGECYTTVYKNSLAAMAFIHQQDLGDAESIFDVFQNYYNTQGNNFQGFPQVWDACAASPLPSEYKDCAGNTFTGFNYWVGDNAFLLLAFNYYGQVNGGFGKYGQLVQGLVSWLSQEVDVCEEIFAEGVANMYAALKPFGDDSAISQTLDRLSNCFFSSGLCSSVNYANVLDHTVRGALVLCDTAGFQYVNDFARSETWAYDDLTVITAYSAFKSDSFINIEISAQILLAWKIRQSELQLDLSNLQSQLEKLLLPGTDDPESMGLPYFVTDRGFPQAHSLPIIDSTCYLLFYYWNFNPFAPGTKCAEGVILTETKK